MRSQLKRAARATIHPILRTLAHSRPKTFSAMVRVRNEEEFLYPSIKSIIDHIEQVVLIDNLSTDRTPQIIHQLKDEHPTKIASCVYPHVIARYGSENLEIARTVRGRLSPRLLANYYNWCLQRCTEAFVIKWDADMIATSSFYTALDFLRNSPKQVLFISGANVHPNRTHTVVGTEDNIIAPYENYEPRIFPKQLALYNNRQKICENLFTPYEHAEFTERFAEMTYLHMKFCKLDYASNASPDMVANASLLLNYSYALDKDMLNTIRRWGLESAHPQKAHSPLI